MPTIHIDIAPPLSSRRKRAVAVALTRWFADRGSTRAHVVVRYTTPPPGDHFVGGLPIEALATGGEHPHHVSVVCRIAGSRGHAERLALTTTLMDLLGVDDATASFVVQFRPTDPADVHTGDGSAIAPPTTSEEAQHDLVRPAR